MATTLEDAISTAAKTSHTPAFKDGQTVFVDIESLDDNPFQPRVKMDAAELDELASSIRTQGLIQSIAVRPTTNGRCIIVAGHRRVAAYRKLREAAPEGEKVRFASIKAEVRLALDDSQLASMAYAENVTRSGLTPVEEGRALERMVDAGLARTNEELAVLTSQPVAKIRRLRRIGKAPKFIRDAIDVGIIVTTGKSIDGASLDERRHLELMAGLQFVSLFEQLQKGKPQKAEERVAGAIRRSLAQNWSLRRVEEFVQAVAAGKRVSEGEASDDNDGVEEVGIFERTARRFVVDLSRLSSASDEQVARLRTALEALIAERLSDKKLVGDHQ